MSKLKRFFWFLKPVGSHRRLLKIMEVKQSVVVLATIMFVGFEVILLIYLAAIYMPSSSFEAAHEKNIATLNIDQEITGEYVQRIIDNLDLVLEQKEDFAHLLIIMQSGGGSPQASEELTQYLIDFQKEGIDLTVYVESICASGAFYIATASKYDVNNSLSGIIANQNAIVGSIGVIMPNIVIEGSADKLGIAQHNITVGKYKEPISPFKVPTQAQTEYLKENLLAPVYNNFVKIVAQGRGMSVEELQPYTEGRIFVANDVVGPIVDRISYLSKIKKEIKAKVRKDFPDEEVGFSPINTAEASGSLFNTSFNLHFDSPLNVKQDQILMR
jgi:protease-4